MKPPLLFLSAFLPSPVSSQAGQKTAFRHLRWLAERHDIWFVGFRNEIDKPGDEARLRELCREVHLFPLSWPRRIAGALRRPWIPLLVSARWRPAMAQTVRDLAVRHEFARVHCEWTQMAEYLELVPQVRERWVSTHDVVLQFCARAAASATGWRRVFWRWEARRARHWEESRYARATVVLLQSPKDAELVRREFPQIASTIRVIPPYFERYRPQLRSARAVAPTLLFWGALSRVENSEAAIWLARELLPAVQRHLPGTRLILAGSNPPEEVRRLATAQVEVPGFVADPQQVFDSADLAVLPLFRGAGIKVKVLECLAAGLPVLTSPIGAEGITADETDGLGVLAPAPEEYATRLAKWWGTPGRTGQLSEGALAWGRRQQEADRTTLFLPE